MRFAGNFGPEWGYLSPAPSFMRTARMVVVATAIGATAGAAVVVSLIGPSTPGPIADASKTMVVVRSLVQPAEAATPAIAAVAKAAPVIAAVPAAPIAVPPLAAAKVEAKGDAKTQASAPPAAPENSQASLQARPLSPQTSAPSALAAPTAPLPVVASAPPPTTAQVSAPAASDSHSLSTPTAPASVAALAESPPVTEAALVPATARDMRDITTIAVEPPVGNAAKKHPVATQQPQRNPPPIAYTGGAKKRAPEEHGLAPILRRLFSSRD